MRLYRILVHLFPSSFRIEYGEEMCGVVAERLHRASGPLERVWLGLRAVKDLVAHALRAHVDILRQDLLFVRRSLRRSPGFAVTAVLVSALGIGATTAVFTATDRVLIRPLPYADAGSLVKVWAILPSYRFMELSPGNFHDLREAGSSFERLAAYHSASANLVGAGAPMRLQGVAATADLFPLLGVRAEIGRTLGAEDEAPEAPDTVVLSHGLWQRVFAGDRRVIGTSVRLDDVPFTVVGVMPPGFGYPSPETSFWRPLRFQADDFTERDNNYLSALGRLAPGVSRDQASVEVAQIAERLANEFPVANRDLSAHVVSLRSDLTRGARMLLLTLLVASICVLLVACTNLASLLWVRALGRRQELAVRSALGAGRERMVRQLLTESLVLACCGGVLGVGLAALCGPLLSTLLPSDLPNRGEGLALDLRMLGFAAVMTLGTGIAFGIAPAMGSLGQRKGLWQLQVRAGVGAPRGWGRGALVVTQVAASVVLLVVSGLMLQALWRVQKVDPGFRVNNVLTLETPMPMTRYAETSVRADFYDRVLERIRALPQVDDAAYISFVPLLWRGGIWPVEVPGSEDRRPETASLRFVTPGFFSTLSIPLLAGRDVEVSDTEDRAMAAVVSRSFAERYWPGRDPLGHTFDFAFRERVVVGMVGDVRFRGLEGQSEPQVYLPYRQVPDGAIIFYAPKSLVVKASTNPLALLPEIRAVVHDADPELPIARVRLLSEVLETETASRRTLLAVLGSFAALALALAGVGIHGLLAFAVRQRIGELGVRRALGASGAAVVGTVLGRALRLAAVGGVLGALAALVAGQMLEALLAGGEAADPMAFSVSLLVVAGAVFSGSLAPTLLALRVEPTAALRLE